MKYDEIFIGQHAEIVHTVTQKDIEKFVNLSGDDNKLHVDEEFASKTSFKKPVVHGMIGASFISTIIGTKIPGDGSLWFSQTLDFLLPVRVGDELRIFAEVIKKHDRDRVIELKTDIYNQYKQKVTTGVAKVKIVEPEAIEETQAPQLYPAQKVALIIGASGGIGSSTALALAHEGWDLLLHYNSNKEKVEYIQKQIEEAGRKCYIVQADLLRQDTAIIESLTRHFGTLSAFINCATVKIPNIKFTNLEWQDIQNHFDINIKSNFFLIKALLPFFEPQKYGKIVCMSSQAVETPSAEWLHYITAKSALNGFVKSLAIELAPKGIRANLISPGMTKTDLIGDIPERARLLAESKTPLKRLANPEDVANAIVFLVSEKSDYMTGETIRVNGGQVML